MLAGQHYQFRKPASFRLTVCGADCIAEALKDMCVRRHIFGSEGAALVRPICITSACTPREARLLHR